MKYALASAIWLFNSMILPYATLRFASGAICPLYFIIAIQEAVKTAAERRKAHGDTE